MKKKSLKSLTLNRKAISKLSDYHSISGGYTTDNSFAAPGCVPDTDIGGGASCTCTQPGTGGSECDCA